MTDTPSLNSPLLDVDRLTVSFGNRTVVRDVSFTVNPGECVALVGESGSGKSVTARALLGLAGVGARVTSATLNFEGAPLPAASSRRWRNYRGSRIALVLQDALVSLDPLRPVGREIDDALRLHTSLSRTERRARVTELLQQVHMPEPAVRATQRSGELSGGLRQRALIAAALAAEPSLLIADEPTTALDVTVQAHILELLDDIRRSGTGLVLISHDLAVVSSLADRVVVMRRGEAVEQGPTARILRAPTHPYTQQLLESVPRARRTSPAIAARNAAPVFAVRSVSHAFNRRGARPHIALRDVSLSVPAAQTLGIVGESGSGKTTLARVMLGLLEPDAGDVVFRGEPWTGIGEARRRPQRHHLAAITQDPASSFDPRYRVGRILADAAGCRASDPRVTDLLADVGLDPDTASRLPRHLSGGQRQRVAIARALASRPDVLICDEPVSALDVTIQAQILRLLDDLQRRHALTLVIISHDLAVIRQVADHVAVMHNGQIVEQGQTEDIFARPRHDYTRRLLGAAPVLAFPAKSRSDR